MLLSALHGVQIGESERAALWWVASSATTGTIRALARLIARARSRGTGVDIIDSMPEPAMPPVAASVIARHGLG